MIFVTTGTSALPFGRLIREVDRLAKEGIFAGHRVLVQYRGTDVRAEHCEQVESLDFGEMIDAVREADLVIGHGGVGTLLLCGREQTPPLLVARRAAEGENHDDHQVHFCEYVAAQGLADYAEEMADIGPLAAKILAGESDKQQGEERGGLVEALRAFARESLDHAAAHE